MADKREWIIQGMGRCIVIIEQLDLPEGIGGILVTSHNAEFDYFKLHILIHSGLCGKSGINDRIVQKLTTVHEFTHTTAALSAISRVRSKELIKRLKEIFHEKAHALYVIDIQRIAAELNNSLRAAYSRPGKSSKTSHFPDEHYRLGFEDFPVSYPIIFEEFLLSKEMFEEYFSASEVEALCKIAEKESADFLKKIDPLCQRISEEKALDINFVKSRVLEIFIPKYRIFLFEKRT
jgi:predicted RNA-binding protein with RPS1 domain